MVDEGEITNIENQTEFGKAKSKLNRLTLVWIEIITDLQTNPLWVGGGGGCCNENRLNSVS